MLDADVLAGVEAGDENGFSFPGGVPRLLDARLAMKDDCYGCQRLDISQALQLTGSRLH